MGAPTAKAEIERSSGLRVLGAIGAAWGLVGVIAPLLVSVVRLYPAAAEALTEYPLAPGHWLLTAGTVGFMAYSEGYRGFQRAFSPRVVVRALALAREPRPWLVVLAPVYCMGLVHASRRRLVASWILVIGIVVLVLLVRGLAQPYRGIVDAGVVVGLGWGAVSLLVLSVRALAGRAPDVPADLPDGR